MMTKDRYHVVLFSNELLQLLNYRITKKQKRESEQSLFVCVFVEKPVSMY